MDFIHTSIKWSIQFIIKNYMYVSPNVSYDESQ